MATQQIYTTNDSDTVDGTLRPGDLAPYSSDFTITDQYYTCLLYTSPSPRDRQKSRMPSSA